MSAKHLEFVRSQACVCSAAGDCYGPIQAHHHRTASNSGIGMKPADTFALPLCMKHHAAGHKMGWKTFERKYRVDLAAEARFLASAADQEMP
jgi:hypothetical protein